MKKFLSLLMMTLLTATAWAGTVTFSSFGTSNWTTVTDGDTYTMTSNGVTITVKKNTSNTATSQGLTDAHLRVYQGAQLIVESSNNITEVAFTTVSSYPATRFKVNGTALTSATWTGNTTSVTFDANQQVRLTQITVTYTEAQSNVATPTITLNPAEGPYYEGTTVTATIASETTGATCYYSTNDGETWTEGTTVALTTTTTLSAKAVLGNDESNVATKTVTFVPAPVSVATIAEYKNLGIGDEFTFTGNVTVTYVNGNNLYVKDATGAALIFGYDLPTFTAGQVLNAGWTGKTKDYNGLLEVDQAANLSASNETVEVTPTEYAVSAITTANDNEYIIVKNVTLGEVSNRNFTITDAENNTVTGRTNFNGVTHPTDLTKNYDVTCCVGEYNGTVQLYPTEYVAVQEPAEEVTLTITPDATGNVYDAPVEVSITCSDPEAIVTYKLGENGTEQDYTEPFTIYESTTVYAYAMSGNAEEVIEASMTYNINLAPIAVTFTPAAGTYEGTQNVKVAIANTYGDVVATYYLNNEEVQYDDQTGIEVAQSATVKVEVMDEYHAEVAEFTAEYVITEPQPVTTTTFALVNSADELEVGKRYIIVAKGSAKASGVTYNFEQAISATPGNNILNGVDVTSNEGEIELSSDAGVAVFTLGGEADAYTWAVADGLYLNKPATKNQAKFDETATETAVAITSGEATITTDVDETPWYLSYNFNSNNPRFAFYASLQNPNNQKHYIYKEVEETPEPAKNVIAYTLPENCEMTVALADGTPIVSGETEVEEGTQVVITVTPAEGYQVKSVTVTKTEVSVTPSDDPHGGEFSAPRRADSLDDAIIDVTAGDNGSYTFNMPNSPVSIDVVVEETSPLTGVNDLNVTTGAAVKYVNAQGQVSNRPFQGVNIVIDGNKTYKIVK